MRSLIAAALLVSLVWAPQTSAETRPRNVILFVADGLRAGTVTAENAPAMTALMARGVRFTNTHSLFPTFTTANASGMATGHALGDSGDFSNVIYTGFTVPGAGDRMVAFLESDPVLADIDEHFAGDYLNQDTILKAARQAGFSTASIGKVGPALIFDHTERSGRQTIVMDDMTGRPGGVPLSEEMTKRLTASGLELQVPGRGENGKAGTNLVPGTTAPDFPQLRSFGDVAAKVLLPLFRAVGDCALKAPSGC